MTTETSTIVIAPTVDIKNACIDEEPLEIYCLPVSGGGFVAQLGLLSEIYEAKLLMCDRKFNGSKDYQPNLVFASSGGNVAAYAAMAGDWSPHGMLRIALKLETSMFIKSWFPEFMDVIPSVIIGAAKGSMYREGSGGSELFNCLFTSETIQRVEIWTGTYDSVNHRAQFFCNLCKDKAMINQDYFCDSTLLNCCMPLRYQAGDVDRIAVASVASASIPMLVSKQQLDGCAYLDGGTMYASPLSVMSHEIYRLIMGANTHHEHLEHEMRYTNNAKLEFKVKDGLAEINSESLTTKTAAIGKRSMRLIYFCSYEMNVPRGQTVNTGEAGKLHEALASLIHSNVLQDRETATDILYRICGSDHNRIESNHYPRLDKVMLAELLQNLNKQRHYVLILYPHGAPNVNLHNLNPKDIESSIDKARQAYGAYSWHFPDPLVSKKGDALKMLSHKSQLIPAVKKTGKCTLVQSK